MNTKVNNTVATHETLVVSLNGVRIRFSFAGDELIKCDILARGESAKVSEKIASYSARCRKDQVKKSKKTHLPINTVDAVISLARTLRNHANFNYSFALMKEVCIREAIEYYRAAGIDLYRGVGGEALANHLAIKY